MPILPVNEVDINISFGPPEPDTFDMSIIDEPPTPKTKKVEDKPEQGKIYSLFGGTGEPCIAAGNSWAESEVKEDKEETQ